MAHISGTSGDDKGASALHGTGDDDLIEGFQGRDDLYGLGGNDVLDGGAGADTMTGGDGNDTYYVDNVGDVIVEAHGGGRDIVYSTVTYTLSADIEKLVLTGTANISAFGNAGNNTVVGNDGNNKVLGGAGDDTLGGGLGNDTLDGGKGADSMKGGAGNDRYYIDNVGDVVTEYSNGGNDTVLINGTYTLGANVENLIILGSANRFGTGNALDNHITGSSGDNTLGGAAGNDVIDGGKGADLMRGGTGDDLFYVDNIGDVVSEYTNAGTDGVLSSVTFTLGGNVENLTLTGTNNLAGTGNSLDNSLTGNAGDNVLQGGLGNDIIDGGNGFDTASYAASAAGVVVDLRLAGAQNTHGAGVDTLRGIEGLTGSDFADVLRGSDRVFDGNTVASTGVDGLPALGNSYGAVLAADGKSVLFSSDATNLLPGVSGTRTGIFARDLATGTITQVDTDAAGHALAGQATGYAYGASDHDIIFSLADTGETSGIYSKNLVTGALTHLVTGQAQHVTASADGARVYFLSTDSYTSHDSNGRLDLYVRDLATGSTKLLSSGAGAVTGNNGLLDYEASSYSVSADGHYVAFSAATTGLANGDTNGVENIYLKDTQTGAIHVVAPGYKSGALDIFGVFSRSPIFSPDGSKLLFVSDVPDLVSGAGYGLNVYVMDVATGELTQANNDFDGYIVGAVWAGDSSHVAFIGPAVSEDTVNQPYMADIMVKNLVTGQYQPISYDIGYYDYISRFGGGVSFSADGHYVAYGDRQVYVHDNAVPASQHHGDDIIQGGAGNDKLYGNGGDDQLFGGAGNDRLEGGDGYDQLHGGAGDDTYFLIPSYNGSSPVNDVVIENAGEGIDTVRVDSSYTLPDNVENLLLVVVQQSSDFDGTGNALDNILTGSEGRNVLIGLGGNDTLYGKGGDDTLDGGDGNNILIGGKGSDIYLIHATGDSIIEALGAQEGYDTVRSIVDFTLSDSLEYLALLDSDPLAPDAAAPIYGTTGNLGGTILGNSADNILTGLNGNDDLTGNNGNDLLTGGAGDDHLQGNAGNDELHGGSGVDILRGDEGNDILSDLGADAARDTGNDQLYGGAGDDTLTAFGNGDFLDGDDGNDHLEVQGGANDLRGDNGNDTLIGGSGADRLDGGYGDDIVHGNGGDDNIAGYVGIDVLDGGDGNDVIVNSTLGDGNDTITGGTGNDNIQVNGDMNTADGGAGNDELHGIGTGNVLTGGAGSDFITMSVGPSTLDGGDGDDFVYGGSGNDTISGGTGDDILWGGGGVDKVDGGAGNDGYVLTTNSGHAAGVDSDGQDFILLGPDLDISQLLITTVAGITYYGLKDTGSTNTDASLARNYITFAAGSIESQKVWADLFGPSTANADTGEGTATTYAAFHAAILTTTWDYVHIHDGLFGG